MGGVLAQPGGVGCRSSALGALPCCVGSGVGGTQVVENVTVQTFQSDEERRAAALAECELDACDVISGRLYLSGRIAARDDLLIKKLGITEVLDFGAVARDHETERTAATGSTQFYLNDSPHEDIGIFLYQVLDRVAVIFDDSYSGAILIHCEKGVSRSCTYAIACLMHFEDLTFAAALRTLTAVRPVCDPNVGFQCQLMEWQKRRQRWRANEDPGEAAVWRITAHSRGPDDKHRLVPRLCLENATRRVLQPSRAVLDTRTAFVIVPDSRTRPMIVWIGTKAPVPASEMARKLVPQLQRYEGLGDWHAEEVHESAEPDWLVQELERCGALNPPVEFEDLAQVAHVAKRLLSSEALCMTEIPPMFQ
eukprot:TRINITY_DN6365_c0_g4_i1.p1 TRINITY_DN6365_c0_g4~~TRINITY_DN6365_c0_g4_i1.p1  ORF type:complete len:365 (+),score=46.16 TRINITY_DN6365_c0_g4_i1:33-1127(+)